MNRPYKNDMESAGPLKYSVLIPVFNSEPIVERTVSEVIRVFEENGLDFEILLINDGSRDGSWEKIKNLADGDDRVISIDLLRNYGQHTAVFCGIRESTGDYVITMDDDLQNPPQEALKLIEKAREGYDLVFGRFPVKKHGLFRRLGSRMVGYLNRRIFGKPKELVLSNFRIFDRTCADRVGKFKTFFPYIPGLLLWSATRPTNVETEHHSRAVGGSNYSIFRIMKLVARLLFNYSSYPLKVLTSIGLIISLLSFLAGIFYVVKSSITGVSVQGWTTVVVLLSFLNGFVILMLGALGEYVARIMDQVSHVEAYQIRDKVG